jgi:hypothetical protein
MEILNFSDQEGSGSKKRSKSRAFIGIGVIAAAVGLSSTLAANISINSGPVEFGQGVAQTVACSGDESIIVTPATSFTNAPSSVEREITFYGGDTVTVESTENLSVGMLLALQSDVPYVITEINGLVVRMSQEVVEGGWSLPMTFTPSSGTEQKRTPLDVDGDPYAAGIGVSSMVLDSTSIEVGMLVSGPGIPANTTVVYTGVSFSDSGEGIYIELSKDTEYSTGELTFTNSGRSSFKLSNITVSGIPDTCNNKVFTVKLYDNESAEPLIISNWNDTSAQVWWANGYESDGRFATDANLAVIQFPANYEAWESSETNAYNNGPAIETADTPDSSMAGGAFKINLPIPVDASTVYKITIESQDDSDAFNVSDDDVSFYDWWWA